jgi:prepilin-type N-terminal cleavage/methylation domain-containing protein
MWPQLKQTDTRRGSRPGGFTLTELLAVIAVVALAASLGGTSMVNTYRRLVVEKGARDVFSLMRYAKVAAVEYQSTVLLQIDQEQNRAWLEADLTDALTGLRQREIIRNSFCKPVTLGSGVTFQNLFSLTSEEEGTAEMEAETAEGDGGIRFLPNGTATDVAIQIGNAKYQYTVVLVAATGRARLQTGPIQDLPPTTIDLDRAS